MTGESHNRKRDSISSARYGLSGDHMVLSRTGDELRMNCRDQDLVWRNGNCSLRQRM